MRHPRREEKPALHGRGLGPREPGAPSRGVDQGVVCGLAGRGGQARFFVLACLSKEQQEGTSIGTVQQQCFVHHAWPWF